MTISDIIVNMKYSIYKKMKAKIGTVINDQNINWKRESTLLIKVFRY